MKEWYMKLSTAQCKVLQSMEAGAEIRASGFELYWLKPVDGLGCRISSRTFEVLRSLDMVQPSGIKNVWEITETGRKNLQVNLRIYSGIRGNGVTAADTKQRTADKSHAENASGEVEKRKPDEAVQGTPGKVADRTHGDAPANGEVG